MDADDVAVAADSPSVEERERAASKRRYRAGVSDSSAEYDSEALGKGRKVGLSTQSTKYSILQAGRRKTGQPRVERKNEQPWTRRKEGKEGRKGRNEKQEKRTNKGKKIVKGKQKQRRSRYSNHE